MEALLDLVLFLCLMLFVMTIMMSSVDGECKHNLKSHHTLNCYPCFRIQAGYDAASAMPIEDDNFDKGEDAKVKWLAYVERKLPRKHRFSTPKLKLF